MIEMCNPHGDVANVAASSVNAMRALGWAIVESEPPAIEEVEVVEEDG